MSDTKSQRARKMIEDVEQALKTETPAQVASRFGAEQEEFPRIFEMLLSRDYRRDLMEMMLQQLERMEIGRVSQHDASVAVGTVLVDTIVKPQLKGKK